jgi:hypothetical protein
MLKTDRFLVSPDLIIDTIELFLPLYSGDIVDRIDWILGYNIWSYNVIESDFDIIYGRYKYLPSVHNLFGIDFLVANIRVDYDHIFDSFPLHGFDIVFTNDVFQLFGRRNNMKINSEYYSIIKSVELLIDGGQYTFKYTDEFPTSKKTESIRKYLLQNGTFDINYLKKEIHFTKSGF